MGFINKIKNAFGYSHPGNKKIIQKNIDEYIKLIRYHTDVLVKIVSDFRTAHMNIIAGMIAFLGFINKDGIKDDIHFKYGVIFLLIFIAISIVAILISFYYDAFTIKSNMKYLSKYVELSKEHKNQIKNFEFNKDQAESMNKKLYEFKVPSFRFIGYVVNILYLVTWTILIYGLYNIIIYYIGMI